MGDLPPEACSGLRRLAPPGDEDISGGRGIPSFLPQDSGVPRHRGDQMVVMAASVAVSAAAVAWVCFLQRAFFAPMVETSRARQTIRSGCVAFLAGIVEGPTAVSGLVDTPLSWLRVLGCFPYRVVGHATSRRVEDTTPGFDDRGFCQIQCVAFGGAGVVCEMEGWFTSALSGLPGIGRSDHQGQVPFLPSLEDLFDQLLGSCGFLKIVFQSDYHQLKVKAEDFPRTVFRLRYGHSELQPCLLDWQMPLLRLWNY